MAKTKKKRTHIEFVLSEKECQSVLALGPYLACGLVTFDITAIRKLNRKLARIQPEHSRTASTSRAMRRLKARIPRVGEDTLALLGKVLFMIKSGTNPRRIFRQHLTTKPATHRTYLASISADYYYEQRARRSPTASDRPILRRIRAMAPDLSHLDDPSMRRMLRRHKDRAIADLRERARRQARGIPPDFLPWEDAPTPQQVEDLVEHLRRKSARVKQI